MVVRATDLDALVRSVAERLIVGFPTGALIVGLARLYRGGGRKFLGDLSVHDKLLETWFELDLRASGARIKINCIGVLPKNGSPQVRIHAQQNKFEDEEQSVL